MKFKSFENLILINLKGLIFMYRDTHCQIGPDWSSSMKRKDEANADTEIDVNKDIRKASDLRPGIDTLDGNKTVSILVDYLLGEDWYIVDPVSTAQANPIILDAILKKYSKRYRTELRQKRNLKKYENKLSKKLESKKRRMERRKLK